MRGCMCPVAEQKSLHHSRGLLRFVQCRHEIGRPAAAARRGKALVWASRARMSRSRPATSNDEGPILVIPAEEVAVCRLGATESPYKVGCVNVDAIARWNYDRA